jgi:hypothetical protein
VEEEFLAADGEFLEDADLGEMATDQGNVSQFFDFCDTFWRYVAGRNMSIGSPSGVSSSCGCAASIAADGNRGHPRNPPAIDGF